MQRHMSMPEPTAGPLIIATVGLRINEMSRCQIGETVIEMLARGVLGLRAGRDCRESSHP